MCGIWEGLGSSLGQEIGCPDGFSGVYQPPEANDVTEQQLCQLRSLLFSYLENHKNYGKSVPDIEYMFHSVLQILFQTFFVPINTSKATLKIREENHVGLLVKYPVPSSDFNPNWNMMTNLSKT
jgi:hypothetical protein